MTEFAWLDGRVVPREEARVSVDDFAVRYGAACFETMLARNGAVFRLDAHLDRLLQGLRGMGVAPPEAHELAAAVEAALAANWLLDASVRLTVTAGHGHAPDLAVAAMPSVVVTVDELPPAPRARALRVASTRVDEGRPLAFAKTAQFLPYLLARAEARAAGADDALLLNHAGHVVEAATANIFVLLDGRLVTPPLSDGPLPGITRDVVIEVAAGLGIPGAERSLTVAELADAGAILLTSSVAGVVAAASLDASPPACEGTLHWEAPRRIPAAAIELAEAYEALIDRECDG